MVESGLRSGLVVRLALLKELKVALMVLRWRVIKRNEGKRYFLGSDEV
jgi:hypothetical protein